MGGLLESLGYPWMVSTYFRLLKLQRRVLHSLYHKRVDVITWFCFGVFFEDTFALRSALLLYHVFGGRAIASVGGDSKPHWRPSKIH